MPKLTFRNSQGKLIDISTVAATKVKNEFGSILEKTMHSGAVAITRHDTPKAVLLSFAEFESLVKERSRSLDDLNSEFDELLARMQTPQARKGVEAAFHASPAELGRAAVKAAKKASRTAAQTRMSAPRLPRIHVLAGVNGAGKSSVGGAAVRQHGSTYFNPDEAARTLREKNPALTQTEANGVAWRQGLRLLKQAIKQRLDFTFETTLGGNTITGLLTKAAEQNIELHVWYVGLSSPELHIARVQARVRRGGHDIPAEDIHRRYEHSRLNLIALLPHLTTLHMYDNSADADPAAGRTPKLKPVLHMERGRILGPSDLASTPNWAKPIVAAALKLHRPSTFPT